jgi:hypothetical protein
MEPTREPTIHAPFERPHGWTRYASLVLGAWLVISAFSWSHPPPTASNTWILGLIVIIANLATLHTQQPARWIDRTAAAALVILSLPLARYSAATALNSILVAAALVWLSFAPQSRE